MRHLSRPAHLTPGDRPVRWTRARRLSPLRHAIDEPSASKITTPDALPEEAGRAEAALRPSRLDEFVGQEQVQGLAPDRHRRRPRARRAARPHALLRPARAGQDHARHADGAGNGRAASHVLRAGAREAGRPGRAAHHARPRRHPVHRRDPPAPPGARGVPLSRHGGLSAWTCASPRARTPRRSR